MEHNKSVEMRTHDALSSEFVTCEFDNTESKENEKNIYPKTCRVCLDPGNIPIFGDGISPDVSADVNEFGGIEINLDDVFPKYICDSCAKLLEAAIMFRKTAKQSDESLRSNERCYQNADYAYESIEYLKTETNNDTDYEYNGAFEAENTINIKDEFTAETSVVNYHINGDVNALLKKTINISTENITTQDLQNVENPAGTVTLTPNKYSCKTCDQNFPSSKEYTNHKKSAQHKKARFCDKIECKVCSKEISSAYYNRHMELHSNECEDDKLQCPICNKSYSKTYFNYHITHTHNKEQKKTQSDRIECSICNKSYEKQYYKFHLAIHDNDNASSKYVCDTCGKSFIQQSAFKRHRLVHSTELAYKCSLCPYRGRHPGLVKTHMQTHTRDYQHRCMECPARFLTKSNLNKHLQRHKGPVDFKCDTCKRGFYSKLELDRHFEADHLGVKNHFCNICGKAFGYRNAMMSHQLKVHKREKLTNGKGRLPLYLEAKRKNEN